MRRSIMKLERVPGPDQPLVIKHHLSHMLNLIAFQARTACTDAGDVKRLREAVKDVDVKLDELEKLSTEYPDTPLVDAGHYRVGIKAVDLMDEWMIEAALLKSIAITGKDSERSNSLKRLLGERRKLDEISDYVQVA